MLGVKSETVESAVERIRDGDNVSLVLDDLMGVAEAVKTWQLVGSSGTTLGTVKAVTAKGAVLKWRDKKGHADASYDKLYRVKTVKSPHIIFR